MGNKVSAKRKSGKKLTTKDIALLKQTSKLSENDIRNMHAYFWSQYPNGKIDRRGFLKLYQEIKHVNDETNILYQHIFAVYDRDHSGTIDFQEFVMAMSAETPHDLDSHLQFIFEMADVSGDGQLSLSELTHLLSASLTMAGETNQTDDFNPRKLATTIFDTLGVSTQKKITKKQFIHG